MCFWADQLDKTLTKAIDSKQDEVNRVVDIEIKDDIEDFIVEELADAHS